LHYEPGIRPKLVQVHRSRSRRSKIDQRGIITRSHPGGTAVTTVATNRQGVAIVTERNPAVKTVTAGKGARLN